MHNYFLDMKAISPLAFIDRIEKGDLPKAKIWKIRNEIKPVDLYCYLFAKYGHPNGIQSFLRSDDSDNLIHWEWALEGKYGFTLVQGHNFRSEVILIGDFNDSGLHVEDFISQIKSDMRSYGSKISEIKNSLEKWTQFVNPYDRIRSALKLHFEKLDSLMLNLDEDKVPQFTSEEEMKTFNERWSETAERYTYAIGLTFGLRSMLPVLAETFVNLILFLLCRTDIKNNERLFNNIIRQPIDVRVQSLHINCDGFISSVDYSSSECKKFHSLMNERNDLLHGNVDINKLSVSDVFFNGTVPVFKYYEDFLDKSIGISIKSVRLESIYKDRDAVEEFISYILNCLDSSIRKEVEFVMSKGLLGFNKKTSRVGILFPDHMIDTLAGSHDDN